jgi:hypothetical protein
VAHIKKDYVPLFCWSASNFCCSITIVAVGLSSTEIFLFFKSMVAYYAFIEHLIISSRHNIVKR